MPAKQNSYDLSPLLDTQQNQLGLVVSVGDNIDSKALALLAINVTLLIFISQSSLHFTAWWQYALILGPYFASLVLDALAVLPKNYLGASIDLSAHPEYLVMDSKTLTLQLLADTKKAISHNGRINDLRWRYCLISIMLTAGGTVALFAIL